MGSKGTYFEKSYKAEDILKVIHTHLGRKGWPKARIYEEVKKVDPDVPCYNSFNLFIKKIEKARERRAMSVMSKIKDIDNLTDDQLMHTALKGIMGLGGAVVTQTIQQAEKLLKEGKPITPEMRKEIMAWFLKGADLHNKANLIKIQANQGELLETIVDNLMVAAQYGKLNKKDDIIEGEAEEVDIKKQLTKETAKVYADS